MTKATTIDEYISGFPIEIQLLLNQLRATIQQAAPEAIEVISYGMPAFKLHSVLVYFAAYNHHIGFYPTSSGIEAFKEQLSPYNYSKGTIQFSLHQPLPLQLIKDIVHFRIADDLQRKLLKRKK
ncbi:MAG: DUF1801 domain-containing protein [Spirosomataceae bacterium]